MGIQIRCGVQILLEFIVAGISQRKLSLLLTSDRCKDCCLICCDGDLPGFLEAQMQESSDAGQKKNTDAKICAGLAGKSLP